jgi:hypothetical protein
VRLTHDLTVTPQFPSLEDYGNFNVLEEWINLSRPTLVLGHSWSLRHEQTQGIVEKINLDLAEAGKFKF